MPTTAAAAPRGIRAGRRFALLAALGVLSTVLSGCSNGFDAQTDQIYQPGPGVTVRQDGVYLLNAAIVTDGSGHGTLIGALLNQDRHVDTLRAVIVTGSGKPAPAATILPGTLALPSNRAVQLATSGDVRVEGSLTPGTLCHVTLTFQHGAPITTELPVLTDSSEYLKVPLGAIPSPTSPTNTP